MNSISILIFVTGLVLVFLSYYLDSKKEKQITGNAVVDEEYLQNIFKENEEELIASAKERLDEKIEEELNDVDDKLSHISNEKIMAVSDFSDQLLEKIEQNHKEVVFLYDMLNQKENEMKEFVQEIDKSKLVLEELANKELEKQKMIQHKRIQKELEKQMKKQEELERQKLDLMKSRVLPKEEIRHEEEISRPEPERKVNTQMSALERMGNVVEEAPSASSKEEASATQEENVVQEDGNQNQVILDLYNEGKTIMDIAKMLGKGQGEVKLVIDLFQGARK